MKCPVYIGVAGWSYADWKDVVYTDAKTDQLEYVSRFVDCIEINSTFYRPPFERTVRSWLERTKKRAAFFFTAKLHRSFTHEGKIEREIVRHFHKGFEPLLAAGKLRHLLAQFRYDFADSPENRRLLEEIVKLFSDSFKVTVELRHKSWQSQRGQEFLEGLGVSVCNLDYPLSSNSFNMQCCTIGRDGYFRLHGRNAEKWFSKAGRDETYNYYYNEHELGGIKRRIERLSEALESLTVIANNHYRGAELANALELKAMVTGRKQPVPAGLLRAYPDLMRIAASQE